jgi:chromosomal replication initiator protein
VLQTPDLNSRLEFLRAKAKNHSVKISDELLEIIAQHIKNDLRSLEGALNSVLAYAKFSKVDLTKTTVEKILADMRL